MRIKFKSGLASGAGMYNPGVVYDVPKNFAKPWIESGHAIELTDNEAPANDEPEVNEPNQEQDEFKTLSTKKLKEKYTVKELKNECKKRGLAGYSDKNQAELIKMLKGE